MRRALIAVAVLAVACVGLPQVGALAEPSEPTQQAAHSRASVTVMLELDTASTSHAFARARARGVSASAASTRQAARVDDLTAQVEAQLGADETVLYTSRVLYSGVAVRTTADRVSALRRIPGVKAVHTIVPKSLDHSVSVPLVGANTTWTNPGGTGAGVTVGIIDTGIDYTHADFGGPGTPTAYADAMTAKEAGEAPDYPDTAKVAGGYDFAGNDYDASSEAASAPNPDSNPLDCYGHGTHVAGTVGGYGVKDGDTYDGPYNRSTALESFTVAPGMAPKVTLYALKVFGCEGTTDLVADALDWAADPNGDGNPADHLDVVNMSLGSEFGSADDPDSVASQAAVDLGISVVASAGNSGDVFEISGSPANAAGAISVASSSTNEIVYDTLNVVVDGGAPTGYKTMQGDAYGWLTDTGAVAPGLDGELTRWPGTAWGDVTSMGCTTIPSGASSFASGDVAVLYWDQDSPDYCGSRTATQNARHAGAGGVVFLSVQNDPVPIYGDGYAIDEGVDPIPAAIVAGSDADAIETAVFTAGTVTASTNATDESTLRGTITPSRTDIISSFSSRGMTVDGISKPDVTAPGESILSAHMGYGTGGVAYMGTSMAAPHVAGLAALVLAAHPNWSPRQVKAAIVNNANVTVRTAADGAGITYAPSRAGAGRINAPATLRAQSVMAADESKGATSISFGVVEAVADTTVTRQVEITNLRQVGTANYALSVQDITQVPGAEFSVSPTSVRVAPGATRAVTITLSLRRDRLLHKMDETITYEIPGMRDWETIAAGLLLARPIRGTSGTSMRLPVVAEPTPVSALSAPAQIDTTIGEDGSATGTFSLTGTGLENIAPPPTYYSQRSLASFLQLLGSSDALPDCTDDLQEDCIPFADGRAADLRYVGFAADDQFAYIGIATYGPWRTPEGIASFEVDIDVTGDGSADLAVLNSRVYDSNGDATDVFTADAYTLPYTGDVADSEMLNGVDALVDTAKFNSDVMVLPVSLDLIRSLLPPDPTSIPMKIAVFADNAEADVRDSIGDNEAGDPTLEVDALNPSVRVTGDSSATSVADTSVLLFQQDSYPLTVTASAPASVDLLVLHHFNGAGSRAQVVTVTKKRTTATSLSLNPTRVTGTQRSVATVTVTAASGTPGGKVTILEGSNVVATVKLTSGTGTVTLPRLSVGQHRLVARYPGNVSFLSSESSSVTLRVG